jgi:hypothetical protein
MWYKHEINCVELKGAYLMALQKKQTKSAKSGSSSSPLRGVEEVNLFLAADQDMHCKKYIWSPEISKRGLCSKGHDYSRRTTFFAWDTESYDRESIHGGIRAWFITIPAVDVVRSSINCVNYHARRNQRDECGRNHYELSPSIYRSS